MFWRRKRKRRPRVERRRDPRREISLPLTFQVISGRDPHVRSNFKKGSLKDISMVGLCLYTSEITMDGLHVSYDETPREKNRLLVKLVLPPPGGPIEVLAEAIWFERDLLDDKATFKVGVAFKEFVAQGEEMLSRYLKGPP